MKEYSFTIKLRSDAEPACGFGNETLNSLLPRNENHRVVIPGSHLKGIMRENLTDILDNAGMDGAEITGSLFGNDDVHGGSGNVSQIRVINAEAPDDAVLLAVTRTRIENGHAADMSLRTTEALASGTLLTGKIQCCSDDEDILALVRLALLSVTSVGGGRTRGAGECRITIQGCEKETPGMLLKKILQKPLPQIHPWKPEYRCGPAETEKHFRAVKLVFRAEQPVCIPERPTGKSNVITSSFVIPGTAVAGALLNFLSGKDPELASACFRSPVFRCGPLIPVGENECMLPVRVSNTHKISKLPRNEEHLFGDLMIPDEYLEETDYHWQRETSGLAMKGSDGVLLIGRDKAIRLLREREIPRYFSSHGVINGSDEKRDNLYSMESVCVSRFEGFVFLPDAAAERLAAILKDGCFTAFGKHKSTMGGGILSAEWWNADLEKDYPQVKKLRNRLFIVQTPVVFDLEPGKETASTREIMQKLLTDAGWGELEKESVMTSVLFGWNELKLGKQINGSARSQACRVVLPGSVFLLKTPLAGMPEKLALGLGCIRTPGYGAVLPHPMFAEAEVSIRANHGLRTFASSSGSPVFDGYELNEKAKKDLSVSQIAGLLREVQMERGLEYLEIQRTERPASFWECWKGIYPVLQEKLAKYRKQDAVRMIQVWLDLRKGRKD